jgi:hypothetical protein
VARGALAGPPREALPQSACTRPVRPVGTGAKASAEVEKTLPSARIAADLKPTGRTRQLLGVPCEEYSFLNMKIEVEGSGITASLLRTMVAASRTVTTTVVDTAPLDDQVFAIPAGWRTRNG